MLLQHASSYSRRALEPLSKFPYRLLLLAKSPDDVVCSLRKSIAREILTTVDTDLEINARKAKQLFRDELQFAESEGLLVGPLRVSIRGVSNHWQADTRECERINKLLNLLTERSPGISYELQSARACIKHFLGEAGNPGAGDVRRKWTEFKPIAKKLLQTCLNNWADRRDVQDNCSRWSAPTLPTDLQDEKSMSKQFDSLVLNTKQTVARNWAACYNMMINKALQDVKGTGCPVLNFTMRQEGRPTSFVYYVSVEKVRTTRRLVRCVLKNRNELWIQDPLVFENSLDVVASYWPAVKDGCQVTAFLIQTTKTPDECMTLPFVGRREAGKHSAIAQLKKPSRKTERKLMNENDNDNDRGTADENLMVGTGDDEEDNLFQQAYKILLEMGEEDGNEGHDDVVDKTEATPAVESAVANALKRVVLETNDFALDELDENKSKLETEANQELMADFVRTTELQKARAAVIDGTCPVPNTDDLAKFWTADDIAEAAVAEAVLNNAGDFQY